jgi:hypothetical protein
MAIIVHFEPTGLNEKTYAEVMRRLDAAGAAEPRGRLHHVCYGTPDALRVVDVYATPQDFEAFGKTLVPILGAVGVQLGQPSITPAVNVVRGR